MLIVSLSLCFQYSGCRLQPLVFSQQSSVFSLHPSIHPSIPPTHPSILEQICSKSLACLLAPSSHLVILSVHLIRSSSLHPASASVSVSVSVSVFPDDSGDELQRGRSHLGQPKKDGLALRLAHFGGSRGLVGQMSSLCLFVRFTRECLLCTLGRRLGASVSLFGPLLGALGDLLEASLGLLGTLGGLPGGSKGRIPRSPFSEPLGIRPPPPPLELLLGAFQGLLGSL